jgi:carbon-monoxide dehydrogenase large subunit
LEVEFSVVGSANGTGIGEPVRRREDARLLTGRGVYSDDVCFPGQAYGFVLRSPHAHARIRSIDVAAAVEAPGVLSVLTGADQAADGISPIPHTPFSIHPAEIVLSNQDGSPTQITPHHLLAIDKVRFNGEPVAFVVATSVNLAKDAAEQIVVDYEPLDVVADTTVAAKPDAPRLWDGAVPNVRVDAVVGDPKATEIAFSRAAHVVQLKTWINRVTGVPMEPRAAVASYDLETQRYTLHAGSGAAFRQKRDLAAVLGAAPEFVRVLMRDVGGNYGTRGGFYPEFALVAWASRRIGRPVKWTCERHESFLSDYQGRDLFCEAELALDAEGNFLAMRGLDLSNVGAHTVSFATLQKSVEVMTSIYRVPAACFRAQAAVSNTMMTRPYRATGRPEAMFVMERLIDLAALDYGFDRLELRRRNLLPPAALPYTNPFGMTYDNGLYQDSMEMALSLGRWDSFPERAAEAKARGKRRGIGVANYVDTGTGVTRERTVITILPDGVVDLVVGTVSNGQGHETSYAQLLHDWLGVPIESVRLITGDTDIVTFGGGSHSGRSMRLASIIMHKASQRIIEKGMRLAEILLEAPLADIQFANGRFEVRGTNHGIGLFEVARAADTGLVPEELRGRLEAECDEDIKEAAFPYGCHVCEVEIDPDTGTVDIVHYTAVDDVGRAVNPLIVHGQTHGGIAQGVGQAVCENIAYDRETGQLLSGSFMDYAMPRAAGLPSFTTKITEVPATTHPMGIRPGGEGGTTPALAVVINAIVHALSEFGVKHVEMPATPDRIWSLIHRAQKG